MLFCCHAGFAQNAKNIETSTPLFNPVTNCQLRYYYFPNLEAYFDTKKSIYYYKEKGEWITEAIRFTINQPYTLQIMMMIILVSLLRYTRKNTLTSTVSGSKKWFCPRINI